MATRHARLKRNIAHFAKAGDRAGTVAGSGSGWIRRILAAQRCVKGRSRWWARGEWTEEAAQALLINPFYAVTIAPILCDPHEPVVERQGGSRPTPA